jgi:rhodanese-related sulfurtransferase
MNRNPANYAGEQHPVHVWDSLADKASVAHLVDVRTMSETAFVGIPDLTSINKDVWLLEWKVFPRMCKNENFLEDIASKIMDACHACPKGVDFVLYFICRSGCRSDEAAAEVENHLQQKKFQPLFDHVRKITIYNVAEGFEGEPDVHKHRNTTSGWKFHNLPWKQT